MRTLERLALIAIVAVLTRAHARAEEGPSFAAGAAQPLDVLGSSVVQPYPQAAPDVRESPLGRNHLWFKLAQADFQEAGAFWGVDQGTHIGVEYYRALGRVYHMGGEFGATRAGSGVTPEGESIRDFGFYSLELNNKWAFDLKHGWTADLGFGAAMFWAQGDEVIVLDGVEYSSPLASFGAGFQVFGDLTWRVQRLLIGADVKYQSAADFLTLDYSNLRFGVHVGFAF